MNKINFIITKKKGLIIIRLNPEEYFNKKFNNTRDYHYNIGRMHGELLSDELQEMANYLPGFLIETRGERMGKMAYKVLMNRARTMKKYIRQEYLAEIEGVAKGAKVDPNFILLINVFDELKNCQSNLWIIPTILDSIFDLGGCSALVIEAKKDQMRYAMITDYAVFGNILGKTNTVFIYQKKIGPSFVTVGWPGYVGLIRGMNDQGTILLATASYSNDQTIKGNPTSFLYREVVELDRETIEIKSNPNQLSFIKIAPRTIGNNILIGNQEKVKLIEVSAKHCAARNPGANDRFDGKKNMIITNHYTTEELKITQRLPVLPPGSTIPSDKIEDWFWGFFGLESDKNLGGSKGRTEIIKREVKRHIREAIEFSPENIKKILSNVASEYTTLNAMIFDPINLELYMADNEGKMPATKGKLVKINVGNLFKR